MHVKLILHTVLPLRLISMDENEIIMKQFNLTIKLQEAKTMKKILSIIMVVTMISVLFSGCSKTNNSSDKTGQKAEQTKNNDTAENKETKPITFQIAYENNPGEPIDLACNEWKRLIEEKSNGSFNVELFPSSQLGSKTDVIDQMIAGSPIVTLADGAFYAERGVPDFGIVFAPYLFSSWEECWKLTESDWYAEQCAKLEENGLKVIASNWIYGDRHTLTTKPVKNDTDLKGMKIRVANSPVFIKGFEALGAAPTPLALGDVYTALQQGTIDGLENPLPVLYNGKFQEVAKYLILDGHVKNFTTWCIGTDFYNSLTTEQQNIIVETANEAGIFNNNSQKGLEEEALKNLIDSGVTVYNPTAEDLASFKESAMKFYDYKEISGNWTEGLYDTVNDIIQK